MTVAKKTTKIVSVSLRLPEWLHGEVADAALKNKRSAHAELIHRLEQSFGDQTTKALEDIASRAATQAVELAFKRLGDRRTAKKGRP
jgi:hypothetical protein